MSNSKEQSHFILRAALVAIALVFASAAQAGDTPTLDRSLTGGAGVEQGTTKSEGRATYIVQFSEPAAADYVGGIGKLKATSTQATGARKLDARSAESTAYVAHLHTQQDAVLATVRGVIGGRAEPMRRYYYALNGVALRMSSAEAETVAKMSGVARVQRDIAYPLETDRGPALIGAPSVWDGSATGVAAQGEGMVVGILDSGINQGHPSFTDTGDDGYGTSGEYASTNPFGPGGFAGDANLDIRDDCYNTTDFPGLCNNKLIGSWSFIDAWGGVDAFSAPGDPVSKDTDGHGSHVASTAAGNVIIDPPLLDADGNDSGLTLGTVSGVAPHAHIIAYKVCAPSCFASDIAAAIDQAILDGVDALNHSIGAAAGSPWDDLKSLAFKGARAAGIMLQNSAGNSGPGAGTAARINASPWSTSVAASTHDRAFPEKMLENMSGGDTAAPANMTGRAVAGGFTGTIVYAGDYPVGVSGDANFDEPEQCLEPFPPGTFSGEIVVCDRGAIARVQKARNVRDGGASALILANVPGGATSVNDDVHVIPAIHINSDDGDILRAWLASGTGHIGTITVSGPAFLDPAAADVLAGFSSRGPYTGFDFLAPHVSAPGVAIYAAGADLQFIAPANAPSVGAEWGIIGGTSMASPHATGSATLVKQLNPLWTPAEVKSALMTTGTDDMRKEDGVTPADPFDYGGGRIRVDQAAAAGLVLDETIANFDAADPALGGDPSTLNLPDLVSETCTLSCSWQRTVKNVSGSEMSWSVTTEADGGFAISATPTEFTLADGATQTIDVVADTTLGTLDGWNFGNVILTPDGGSSPQQHLTVAALFSSSTNSALFSKSVDVGTGNVGQTLNYQIELTNVSETGAFAISDPIPDGTSFVPGSEVAVVTNGTDITPFAYDAGSNSLSWQGTLDTGSIDVVSDPFPPAGSPFGYVNLADFVGPLECSSVCDDTFISLGGLPPFTFAGTTYTDMVVGSNGFIVAGTDTDGAASNGNQDMPNPTAPNTVIAPFWTDLDLDGSDATDTGAGFIYGGVFNGGQFIVIEWQGVEVWNVPGQTYTFQMQIATNLAANPGIWIVYHELAALPPSLSIGAEADAALYGDTYYFNGTGTAPIVGDLGDLRVDSVAGGSAVFNFDAKVDSAVVGDTIINIANSAAGAGGETAITVTPITGVDLDDDGVLDPIDNCPDDFNPGQADLDNDGLGDVCDDDVDGDGEPNDTDLDDDNDGLSDADEIAYGSDPFNPDSDNDGIGDYLDAQLGDATNFCFGADTYTFSELTVGGPLVCAARSSITVSPLPASLVLVLPEGNLHLISPIVGFDPPTYVFGALTVTSADPCPGCSVCGNGIVEAAEQCDDGNTDDGDGCSATCKIE